MRILVGYSLCAALLLSSLCGCNDAPSEIGTSLLPDTVKGVTISSRETPLLTSDATLTFPTYIYNAGALFIGRTPTSAASTLIRLVNIPDSLSMVSETDIISATILMRPRPYVFGDSSTGKNLLSFGVYAMKEAWIVAGTDGSATTSVRWFDLHTTSRDPVDKYFEKPPIASFKGVIPLKEKDSLEDIRLEMGDAGKKLLASWFKMQPNTEERKKIFGLGFISDDASTVVREFATQAPSALNEQPIRVQVVYRKPGKTQNDTLLLTSGNDASFFDSEKLGSEYIYTLPAITNEGRIFFNISSIPSLDAILLAELTLSLDPTKTLAGNFGPDKAPILVYLDSAQNITYTYSGSLDTSTKKLVYRGIQRALDWSRFYDTTKIKKGEGGKGVFALRSTTNRLERYAYHSLSALDKNLRPELTIVYAPRPRLGGK